MHSLLVVVLFLSFLLQVIGCASGRAVIHVNRGAQLQTKGDFDGAIAEYQTALRLNPDFTSAHFRQGVALHDKGDREGAITEYQHALRLEPDFAEAHHKLGGGLPSLLRTLQ